MIMKMIMIDDDDFIIQHFFMCHTFDKSETFNWIAMVTSETARGCHSSR